MDQLRKKYKLLKAKRNVLKTREAETSTDPDTIYDQQIKTRQQVFKAANREMKKVLQEAMKEIWAAGLVAGGCVVDVAITTDATDDEANDEGDIIEENVVDGDGDIEAGEIADDDAEEINVGNASGNGNDDNNNAVVNNINDGVAEEIQAAADVNDVMFGF